LPGIVTWKLVNFQVMIPRNCYEKTLFFEYLCANEKNFLKYFGGLLKGLGTYYWFMEKTRSSKISCYTPLNGSHRNSVIKYHEYIKFSYLFTLHTCKKNPPVSRHPWHAANLISARQNFSATNLAQIWLTFSESSSRLSYIKQGTINLGWTFHRPSDK